MCYFFPKFFPSNFFSHHPKISLEARMAAMRNRESQLIQDLSARACFDRSSVISETYSPLGIELTGFDVPLPFFTMQPSTFWSFICLIWGLGALTILHTHMGACTEIPDAPKNPEYLSDLTYFLLLEKCFF